MGGNNSLRWVVYELAFSLSNRKVLHEGGGRSSAMEGEKGVQRGKGKEGVDCQREGRHREMLDMWVEVLVGQDVSPPH